MTQKMAFVRDSKHYMMQTLTGTPWTTDSLHITVAIDAQIHIRAKDTLDDYTWLQVSCVDTADAWKRVKQTIDTQAQYKPVVLFASYDGMLALRRNTNLRFVKRTSVSHEEDDAIRTCVESNDAPGLGKYLLQMNYGRVVYPDVIAPYMRPEEQTYGYIMTQQPVSASAMDTQAFPELHFTDF